MKIAIIGGGWIGCHLASKLMSNHSIKIFEQKDKLFTQTSYNNQNRLHLGYHYPRNFKTRQLCKETYDKFLRDYGQFTNHIDRNYYCVPENSNIDFETYLQIFDHDVYIVNSGLLNIEGAINTKERHIDFYAIHQHFNKTLKDIFVQENIDNSSDLSNSFDLVLNCTNNFLSPSKNSYYELTLTLIYDRIKSSTFDSITLVDGDFFSIYPYQKNKYTLTDVEHTPLKVFSSIEELHSFEFTTEMLDEKKNLMESKVKYYYPEFNSHFRYHGFFLSTKSKTVNSSANRYPVIQQNENVISCFTGKIQGIYPIENFITRIIS